ncbi:MAG: hypothetical protein KKC46_17625 [Proteobacteria bacterium]|nr:hypothetical protein [Pseudomonadota bacterium]
MSNNNIDEFVKTPQIVIRAKPVSRTYLNCWMPDWVRHDETGIPGL